jgi:hypothetical protein
MNKQSFSKLQNASFTGSNLNECMRYLFTILVAVTLYSCKEQRKEQIMQSPSPQDIVDRSIAVSGGEKFNQSRIAFQFRDYFYTAIRRKGDFTLSRIKEINGDSVIDILSNEGFSSFVNNEFQKLPDSVGRLYAASVNSVHYFSILPYGLNDPAVRKELLGKEQIKTGTYYKIKVTFNEEGGGEDYEDEFIYWIDNQNYKVAYLAYSYEEEDGRGLRFREAFNERFVNGLRFVDYRNFKPKSNDISLESLGQLYLSEQLELVSTIELEDVSVKLFNL